jgi:hypothetical protein
VGFIILTASYHIPIGTGFSLVAILAGMEKESLPLLKGAALSGELSGSVSMDIAVHDQTEWGAVGSGVGEIQYSLDTRRRHKVAGLQRGKFYE